MRLKIKGFTLMELLIVIVILGIITAFTVVTITYVVNDSKKKAYETSIIGLKSAAYLYVKEFDNVNWYLKSDESNKEFVCVSINTLIESGYIKKNSINFNKDKTYNLSSLIEVQKDKTNSVISDEVILNSGECSSYDNEKPEVEIINKNEITFDNYDGTWVNHNIILTVHASDNNGIQSLKISFDNGSTWGDFIDDNSYEFSENMDKEVIVRAIDNFNNKTEKKFRIRIDKDRPDCNIVLTGTMGNNNWYNSDRINIKLEKEDVLSEIKDWDITTSSVASYNMTDDDFDYTANTAGITYYGYVRDNAGNINNCNISFKKDSTVPTSLNLDSIPSSFTVGASNIVPSTNAVFGISGGNTNCTYNNNVLTNTSSISSSGSYTIQCVSTSNAGKQFTVSKNITVNSASQGQGIPGIICCSTDSYGNRVGWCCDV